MGFLYTFRFTCQLAITEVNYNQIETDICPSSTARHQQAQSIPVPPNYRNLNFEFAVDLDSDIAKKHTTSVDCIPHHIDAVHLLCERRPRSDSASGRLSAGSPLIQRKRSESACASLNTGATAPFFPKKHKDSHLKVNTEVFDTFEQCLHVTNQMESIMAYHYQDEDNKDCYRFEEIYSFREGDIDLGTFLRQAQTSAYEDMDISFDNAKSEAIPRKWKSTTHLENDLEEFVGQRSELVFHHRHEKVEAAS